MVRAAGMVCSIQKACVSSISKKQSVTNTALRECFAFGCVLYIDCDSRLVRGRASLMRRTNVIQLGQLRVTFAETQRPTISFQ
jgi:hypothetical protein